MAKKKSRTSNKKSNDKQKKLLALVLIILFIGLGVFLVVSSFAAKGGKGKPGSGTVYVDSPYAIKAEPSIVKYGSSVTISAVDKLNQDPLNPLPETMVSTGYCYRDGIGVGAWSSPLDVTTGTLVLTLENVAMAQGAQCTAYLKVTRNGSLVTTASTTFTTTP